MKIWVKEFSDVFRLENVWRIVRKHLVVERFVSTNMIRDEDILIVAREEYDIYFNTRFFVYIYEDLMEQIQSNLLQEYRFNYRYYHLRKSIEVAKGSETRTLAVGSSYLYFGLDAKYIPNCVNCAHSSQDLYYAFHIMRDVCHSNATIKNIILGGGWYYFFHDISCTQDSFNKEQMKQVYVPICGDNHHRFFVEPRESKLFRSDIFDTERLLDEFVDKNYERSFFKVTRTTSATRLWEDKSKRWADLSDVEKEACGQQRAERHNRALKRLVTLRENSEIFDRIVAFCENRNIRLIMALTPVSPQYQNHLSPEYMKNYVSQLARHEGKLISVDLTYDEHFTDADFNDMDHLSDSGAEKFSRRIREILDDLDKES